MVNPQGLTPLRRAGVPIQVLSIQWELARPVADALREARRAEPVPAARQTPDHPVILEESRAAAGGVCQARGGAPAPDGGTREPEPRLRGLKDTARTRFAGISDPRRTTAAMPPEPRRRGGGSVAAAPVGKPATPRGRMR